LFWVVVVPAASDKVHKKNRNESFVRTRPSMKGGSSREEVTVIKVQVTQASVLGRMKW
jgi:hypothetical protein